MKLIYAYGSGLGHLNRVLTFISYQKIPLQGCLLITNSKHLSYLPKELKVKALPDAFFSGFEFSSYLKILIDEFSINELIVDVFPAGFYGELTNIAEFNIKTTLLARILKPNYFQLYSSPIFDTVFLMENGIVIENYQYKELTSLEIEDYSGYSSVDLDLTKESFFLIIHSSSSEEVFTLYKYARLIDRNKQIYIQTYSTDFKIEDENCQIIYNELPILSLIENCDKLFTAGGFNIIKITRNYRSKQYIIPFWRRYDDQFLRKKIST